MESKDRIYIRVSTEEKNCFKQKAKLAGYKSLSKFIKALLHNKEIIPIADRDIMLQIRKIGVNINQIALICNQSKSDITIKEIEDDLRNEINNLNDIINIIKEK